MSAFKTNTTDTELTVSEGQPVDPEVGNIHPDGSIYGGISPETGKPFFITAQDAPYLMTHWEAVAYAETLDVNGHKDWTLPTPAELNLLYENRNTGGLADSFNESGSYPAGYYWSSSEYFKFFAGVQIFGDGFQYSSDKFNGFAVRCVRR